MSDTSYEKVVELIKQYNPLLAEHGVKVTMHRRPFKYEKYYHYGTAAGGLVNLLECACVDKNEDRRYHDFPEQYKLLVFQVTPTSKTVTNNKYCKKYAFLTYQRSRAHQGEIPIKWQRKEQTVIARVEKRLKKILKRAQKSKSHNWCNDTFWDALRYAYSEKYNYLESYCGKSSFFWRTLSTCIIFVPILLFAIIGFISSL